VCLRSATPRFYGHSPFPSLFVHPIEACSVDHIRSLSPLLVGSTKRSLIYAIRLGCVWLRIWAIVLPSRARLACPSLRQLGNIMSPVPESDLIRRSLHRSHIAKVGHLIDYSLNLLVTQELTNPLVLGIPPTPGLSGSCKSQISESPFA
jgi:hypothetical protein